MGSLIETSLELLEAIDRSMCLILELRLELRHPNHISDRPEECEEWDEPPDEGRERCRIFGCPLIELHRDHPARLWEMWPVCGNGNVAWKSSCAVKNPPSDTDPSQVVKKVAEYSLPGRG